MVTSMLNLNISSNTLAFTVHVHGLHACYPHPQAPTQLFNVSVCNIENVGEVWRQVYGYGSKLEATNHDITILPRAILVSSAAKSITASSRLEFFIFELRDS